MHADLARRLYSSVIGCSTNEYSSLTPYAIQMSVYSAMTARAAAFIRSRARLSFGFTKPCAAVNLTNERKTTGTQRVCGRE